MAVDLDDGGINHDVFHVRFIRTGVEKLYETIGFDPIAVTLENGVPVSEEGWKVTPWTSCPRNPKQSFDEAAVVTPFRPGSDGLNRNQAKSGILNLNKP